MHSPPPGWGPSQPGPHGPYGNPYQAPAPHAQPPAPGDEVLGLIAPVNVKNGLAFVSGYLGIGALFCMGPVLGIPAVITGVMALKKPELGGAGRAWAGIVMGGLGTLWGAAFLLLRFFIIPR